MKRWSSIMLPPAGVPGLTEMKAMMDWTTCRGINRIVPCGLDTQDPPVWEDAPGVLVARQRIRWPPISTFTKRRPTVRP